MKKLLPVLLLCATLVHGHLHADEAVPLDEDLQTRLSERFQLHLETLQGLGDRRENREGAVALLDKLSSLAEDRGWDYEVIEIEQREAFHSFGRNLRIHVPGRGDGRILVMIPYILPSLPESPYLSPVSEFGGAAEDGLQNPLAAAQRSELETQLELYEVLENLELSASENTDASLELVAAILALLEESEAGAPASNIDLYFIGSLDEDKGIREYLRSNSPIIPDAVLYLSAWQGLGNRVLVKNGDRELVSPLWLVRYIENLLALSSMPSGLNNSRTQLYRLALTPSGNIQRLLEAQFNALELSFIQESEPGQEGPEQTTLPFLYRLIMETGDEILTEQADITGIWDQHYVSIVIGGRSYIMNEAQYVSLLYLSSVFMLLWFFAARRRRSRYLRTLGRNFWNLPLLYAAMFSFIFLGSLMVGAVEGIRGLEGSWMYAPIPSLLLKILSAAFLFTIFFTFLRKIPFSRNGSFYSAGAILLLALDVLIFSIIHINYGYYFLWALFWAFLFSLSRNRLLKLLFFLLSPAMVVATIFDIIRMQELSLIALLVSPGLGINLLVSFILLPFLLMLIRMDFLFPHPVRRGRRSFTLRSSAFLFAGLTLINLIVTLVINPFSETRPRYIERYERSLRSETLLTQDEESSPSSSQPRQIAVEGWIRSSASFRDTTEIMIVPDFQSTGSIANLGTKEAPARLSHEAVRADFLGRSSYSVQLSSSIPVRRYDIRLRTEQDTSLYDSSLPYRFTTGSGEIHLLSGLHPPEPFVLDFTLPAGLEMQIEVRALYEDPGFLNSGVFFRSLHEERLLLLENQEPRSSSGE